MVLAMPVSHPQRPGTVLLKSGVELDGQMICRLREIECAQVWVRYPGLEFMAAYVSRQVGRAHDALVGSVAGSFDRVLGDAHARLDFAAYKRGVAGLIERLRDHPKAALYVYELLDTAEPMLRHAANVCTLSLLVGLRLDFYMIRERSRLPAVAAQDVTNLGLAGLMHDVGMLRVQGAAEQRWGAAADENDPEWRRHVRLGYDMVRGEVDPSVAAAVLHHHQRFDGSGFPSRRTLDGRVVAPAGRDIHVFARIIAACDRFDRLRHPAPGRVVPTVEALRALLCGDRAEELAPVVLAGLLAVCPPYGPGTVVRLSDGSAGVVTAWSSADPCRPCVVRVPELDDPEDADRAFIVRDAATEREPVDLREQTELVVIEADGRLVGASNFYAEGGAGDSGGLERYSIEAIARKMENRAEELGGVGGATVANGSVARTPSAAA